MLNLFKIAIYILCYTLVIAQSARIQQDRHQPRGVFDTPTEFTGWKTDFKSLENLNEIRIGFFMSDNPNDYASQSAYNGAELAISEINIAGGYSGLPLRLVRRWEPDPWKAGPRELINLVYQDSVVAIIGSTDGNSTHIAEQIVTKAWIPLLSPISADPTLNYIRIPWIFRLPPDYASQVKIMGEVCLEKLVLEKIGIITSTGHDGRIFAQELYNFFAARKMVPLFHFKMPSKNIYPKEIFQRSFSFNVQALIIHLDAVDILKLLYEWPEDAKNIVIFLPWIPGLRQKDLSKIDNCVLYGVQPFSEKENSLYQSFFKKYAKRFGEDPSPTAAYAYDAISLLKNALEYGSANRLHIRDALADIKLIKGVTGDISWDNGGGNTSLPVLRRLK